MLRYAYCAVFLYRLASNRFYRVLAAVYISRDFFGIRLPIRSNDCEVLDLHIYCNSKKVTRNADSYR